MKENELRARALCGYCGQPQGHAGIPLFWVVKIQRFGLRLDAIKRQDGLAQFIGSSAIAGAMGENEDLATPMFKEVDVTLCDECATGKGVPIAALVPVDGEPEEVTR